MITKKTLNPITCSSIDFSHQSTSINNSRSLMIRLICSVWIRSIWSYGRHLSYAGNVSIGDSTWLDILCSIRFKVHFTLKNLKNESFSKTSANYQFITKNITGQVLGVFSFLVMSLYIYLSLYIMFHSATFQRQNFGSFFWLLPVQMIFFMKQKAQIYPNFHGTECQIPISDHINIKNALEAHITSPTDNLYTLIGF
jgi:hypothetical protein